MNIDELDFETHPSGLGGTRATAKFSNGFGASVITGNAWYTSEGSPYEIAVLDANGKLTYGTPITDDVLGHLSEAEANKVLSDIEALSPSS